MAADVVYQMIGAGGKRLRPALVILSAGGCDHGDSVHLAAMGVELIHTASMLHDDYLDDAATRRGVRTAHERLGPKTAVLVGDYYFGKGAHLLASIGSSEIDVIISRTLRDLSVGELLEVSGRGDFGITAEVYMERARLKTASLLSASCECGAIVAGRDDRSRRAFRRYGELLGLVFQITDDVLDYTCDAAELGKPAGGDLRQGLATLPLIHAIDDPLVATELRAELRNGEVSEAAAERVVAMVLGSDGVGRALDDARRLGGDAIAALEGLPDGEPVRALRELVRLALDRRS